MKFAIKEKTKIFEGKYLNVWQTEFLDKKGATHYWEWIERRDASIVFPITKAQNVVLIKNYRVPVERYVIELPAGLIDKEGENEEKTARRELLEETGYLAKNFIPLRMRPFNAGHHRNMSFGFIATDLEKKNHSIIGEDTEDIEVIEVPIDGLLNFYLSLPDDILFNLDILGVAAVVKHRGIKG